jgi:hypothetical protein
MSEARQLSSTQVRSAVLRCFNVKRPAFLWGPPGIGKSELVEGITKDLGGKDGKESVMIDLRLGQMEPTDIRGIPFYNRDSGVMEWAPSGDLPSQEFADKYKVVVLFLDELNSAPPSVLAAAYQLILNRAVGSYKLPDNVVMIAAGNRESDKGVTFRMPTPLSNRFVHFEMKVDFESWFDWAVNNNIHKDIVGFLNFSKNDLYDFDPKSSSRAFATPRSWTFVSDLIDDPGLDDATMVNLVAGTVGEGLALKFHAHRKVADQMPNPKDILEGNVKKLTITEISAMYSLVVSMCYELKDALNNGVKDADFHKMADNFFRFMMDNFEVELVVMGARVALTTYGLPILPTKLKNFDEFHKRYGKYINNASA